MWGEQFKDGEQPNPLEKYLIAPVQAAAVEEGFEELHTVSFRTGEVEKRRNQFIVNKFKQDLLADPEELTDDNVKDLSEVILDEYRIFTNHPDLYDAIVKRFIHILITRYVPEYLRKRRSIEVGTYSFVLHILQCIRFVQRRHIQTGYDLSLLYEDLQEIILIDKNIHYTQSKRLQYPKDMRLGTHISDYYSPDNPLAAYKACRIAQDIDIDRYIFDDTLATQPTEVVSTVGVADSYTDSFIQERIDTGFNTFTDGLQQRFTTLNTGSAAFIDGFLSIYKWISDTFLHMDSVRKSEESVYQKLQYFKSSTYGRVINYLKPHIENEEINVLYNSVISLRNVADIYLMIAYINQHIQGTPDYYHLEILYHALHEGLCHISNVIHHEDYPFVAKALSELSPQIQEIHIHINRIGMLRFASVYEEYIHICQVINLTIDYQQEPQFSLLERCIYNPKGTKMSLLCGHNITDSETDTFVNSSGVEVTFESKLGTTWGDRQFTLCCLDAVTHNIERQVGVELLDTPISTEIENPSFLNYVYVTVDNTIYITYESPISEEKLTQQHSDCSITRVSVDELKTCFAHAMQELAGMEI